MPQKITFTNVRPIDGNASQAPVTFTNIRPIDSESQQQNIPAPPSRVTGVMREGALGFASGMGLPETTHASDFSVLPGLKQLATNPEAWKAIGSGLWEGHAEQFRRAKEAYRGGDLYSAGVHALGGSVPLIGPAAIAAGEEIGGAGPQGGAEGRAHGVGTALGIIASLGLGTKKGQAVTGKVVDTVGGKVVQGAKNAPALARDAADAAGKTYKNVRYGNTEAQAKLYPQAKTLTAQSRAGAERVFRAAAPVSMDKQFRGNLYEAAGDLAEIGKRANLSEFRGGIRNADMRPKRFTEVAREYLNEMYQNERAAQINRHANNPIEIKNIGGDATGALEYLSKYAGDGSTRQLAKRALGSDVLTLAETDELARLVNKETLKFQKLDPSAKATVMATNPQVNGLMDLDQALGKRIANELEIRGEAGIKGYERRYAAIKNVLSEVERRTNMIELQRTNPVMKVVKTILHSKGGNALAGASQAAVSDASLGRELEIGLKWLNEGGATPNISAGFGPKSIKGGLPAHSDTQLKLPATGETTPTENYATQTVGRRGVRPRPGSPSGAVPTKRMLESGETIPADTNLLSGQYGTIKLADQTPRPNTEYVGIKSGPELYNMSNSGLREIMKKSMDKTTRRLAFEELRRRKPKQ